MSIIQKYQAALRHHTNPRYMTKDFVVPLYTGTEPDILDDSDTQRESGNYTPFPNEMPIVSPKEIQNQPYEQLKLADGGRVKLKNNILNAYSSLKKDLGRNPSLAEIIKETGKDRGTILNNLEGKKLSQGRSLEAGKTGTAASVEAFKARKVNKPTPTFYEGKLGVKWPDKETEDRYIKQIKGRYQYPAQSFEFNQKVKAGKLLTDKALAKEFGINQANVERINKYIKNTEGLSYPRAEISELEKDKRERRKTAEKKFSDTAYEQKIRGTKETQKSHMGDLYNVKVTPQTIGYAPQEVNLALTGKVDPALKSIVEKQNKLYKNKPENYKQRIEDLNVKGMDYAAQTEGYKVFEALDPKTGKRFVPITSPEKTIDPLGIAGETPLKNLTQEQKAQIELNRKAVMEAQAKIPASEKRRLVQMIGSIGCPTYASGGRVNFSDGSDCFNKGLKALEEGNLTKPQLNVAARAIAESGEEGMLLKNLLSKAGTGIKFTGRGVGELISIGTGPVGVGLGAALETAFAAPYLLEGDYKQALRQSIFGQVPSWLGVDVGSRDEDIIKGAKEAGVDPDSVKKYVELKKNYIENEEYGQKLNMLDTMYKRDPKNLDYAEQIRRIENKIKPSADYLEKTVYSPKDLDKYEKDYLKAASYFVQKNAAQAPFTRSGEQIKSSTRDIVQESLSAVRPEGDVENILKKENLLPQEAPPQEDLPDYYKVSAAEGGRIELGEGSGSKIGRRGFLGLLTGAAAAPDLIKAIKGTGQVGKLASKIKFEKAEGMYPWFPDLVEKIKTVGKPFEEKEIIMEASYKHEAKGYGGLPKSVEKVTKHVDGDTAFLLREYPDGRIAVDIHSPRNQEGSSTPVTLYYRPTMELKYYDGVKIEPAEFKVLEKEPRYFANGPDDVDVEMSEMRKIPGKNTIFGDVEAAERFATGDIKNRKIIAAKQARREQMEDAPIDFIDETSPYGY
jgi:hypothetical protein